MQLFANLKWQNKLLIQAVLVVFAALWLYPIVQSVQQSFKIKGIQNYMAVLHHPKVNYYHVLSNSFIIAISTTILVAVFASLAAFAFSKKNFRLKNLFYYSLVACLAIPPAAVMSPMFFTAKNLGIMNTHLAVILPLVAFNAPFMLMIVKNYFDTIPNTILEAAIIDGCSSFQIYRIIMLPLGMPALINIAVLSFIYSWNDFFLPLLFIRKEAMYTVTLAAQFFTGTTNQTPEMVAQLYAALILMTIPSIIIYVISQKYLQSGLTAGAVKS